MVAEPPRSRSGALPGPDGHPRLRRPALGPQPAERRSRSNDPAGIPERNLIVPFARTTLLALALLCAPGGRSAAQIREPEPQRYGFVSQATFGGGVWVNPAAQGFNANVSRALGYLSFERPEGDDWTTAQYGLAVQAKVLAFGYRHDEFEAPGGFANSDAYTLALGASQGRNAFGVSRTWRTVGPSEGSWAIGWQFHDDSGVSLGLVWRDIGSPDVRGVERPERIVGAITARPSAAPVSLSLELDYRRDGGEFHAFKLGGSFGLAGTVRALALADWDGDGDFLGLRLGVSFRHQRLFGLGGLGLADDGDARSAIGGLGIENQEP